MKKLLIVAAIAATASFAHAGAYIWGLTSGADITPGGGADEYLDGGTAMLFLGTLAQTATGEGTGIDAKNTLDFTGLTYVATSGQDGTAYTFGQNRFDKNYTDAAIDAAGGQDFTIVLFKDSGVTDYENYEGYYYAYTGTSAPSYDADTSTPYADLTSTDPILGDAWRTAGAASPTPPDPAPEPTSGLLLLLGVAGLALKRKRA